MKKRYVASGIKKSNRYIRVGAIHPQSNAISTFSRYINDNSYFDTTIIWKGFPIQLSLYLCNNFYERVKTPKVF